MKKNDKEGFFKENINRREFFRKGAGIVLPGVTMLGVGITSSCDLFSKKEEEETIAEDQLELGVWKSGTLEDNGEIWWFFNSENGSSYSIKWDDSYGGSGSYTADVSVSAYRSNKTTAYFTNVDSGYSYGQTINAVESGPAYIKIAPYSEVGGTFAVLASQQDGDSEPNVCDGCTGGATASSCSDCTGGATSVSCSDCTGGATSVSCSDCTGGATSGCSDCTTGCSASCRDSCHRSCSGTCTGTCSGYSP